MAASEGYLEIAKYLFNNDLMLIEECDNIGRTSLHMAAQCGHTKLVEWLCDEDPTLIGKVDNDTPYMLSIKANHMEIAKWLKENFPKACDEERCIVS